MQLRCRNYLIIYLYEAVRLIKEWENFKRIYHYMGLKIHINVYYQHVAKTSICCKSLHNFRLFLFRIIFYLATN